MTRIILNLEKSRSPMMPPTRSLWRSATAIAAAQSWADSASTDKGEQYVYSITGQVVYTDATSVAVSCGGVAFNCSATANTLKI